MSFLYRIFALFLISPALLAQSSSPAITTNQTSKSNWMDHARFGMFVHFGLYSIPGGVWENEETGRNHYAEWIRMQWGWPSLEGIPREEYDQLLRQFNPTAFDAEEWIYLAAEAGMRYFVITAKHHDGFALWPSEVSEYDIEATPFGATGRDLLGELVAACRKYDVKVGFYYSHWLDWDHPGGAMPPWPEVEEDPIFEQPSDELFQQYWQEKSLPQVRELCQRYQPDMLWFDTWSGREVEQITPERRDELIALVHQHAPHCLINGRIASGNPAGADFLSMGDNRYPSAEEAPEMPWETPGTMNHSWGYHRLDFSWRSFDDLLTNLIGNASYGGANTLNVGPMGNGAFQVAAIRRLRQFAAWHEINQQALHHTKRSLFAEEVLPEGVLSTTAVEEDSSPQAFYLHLTTALGEQQLQLPLPASLENKEDKLWVAQVLETHEFLTISYVEDSLQLHLPAHLDNIDHPVIRVYQTAPETTTYEDNQPTTPVTPATYFSVE